MAHYITALSLCENTLLWLTSLRRPQSAVSTISTIHYSLTQQIECLNSSLFLPMPSVCLNWITAHCVLKEMLWKCFLLKKTDKRKARQAPLIHAARSWFGVLDSLPAHQTKNTSAPLLMCLLACLLSRNLSKNTQERELHLVACTGLCACV